MNELAVSNNLQLSNYLSGLEDRLNDLAMQDDEFVNASSSKACTGPELLAIKEFVKLRLMNSYDLAGVLIRGKIIQDIETGVNGHHLWEVHPQHFSNIDEAAKYYRVSASMLSNIRDWYSTIFPKLSDMGKQLYEVWEEIGTSNFRELTPILKAICTGEPPKSKTAAAALDKIYSDVKEVAQNMGQELDDEELKERAIDWALEAGKGTNRDLRETLRGDEREKINMLVLRRNGTRYIVAEVDEDGQMLFERCMDKHVAVAYLDINRDNPMSIPEVRRLVEGKKK